MKVNRLWFVFIAVIVISFSVLLFFGRQIYREKPPIPDKVVTTGNRVIFTSADIRDGQNIWQSIGGQEVGTIWGHGSYVAPDWSADWLHREAAFMLDYLADTSFHKSFKDIPAEEQAMLKVRLQTEMRENTYDPVTKQTFVSPLRAKAISFVSGHYASLFMNDPKLVTLRDNYAIPPNTIKDSSRMAKMNAFFFWTAWSCVTNRPGSNISYTNNWPSDDLVGNHATSSLILWTGFSVIILLAGIGLMVWFYASRKDESLAPHEMPGKDPLLGGLLTPSMKATLKYFWVVTALILVQILMGAITAHYSVEGQAFYGIPLSGILPYSISRTWHLQLAIFWIATSWLATGLYLAPAVSGKEPKFQAFGVNVLFIALLVIVVGSLIGQWFGVMQRLGLVQNFWFGHQGYEYVDLGRFWQLFLFIGFVIWLFLMGRALMPALKKKGENRSLLAMFLIASIAIALFYGAGLLWGRQTHLAIAEYWRWWVVHLWVEGFFEVFATVAIAFLFVRLGLVRVSTATGSVLLSTIVFLSGGIIGTFHHLYFSGTPVAILALGATFSALEVVPLVLIGFEGYGNLRISNGGTEWIKGYKWPIWFFLSVSFWNLVGAGIFGFLINPPIALYYMQGLNTTPVHAHTALFGVYGMLGIGLMLFVLKSMDPGKEWNQKWIRFAFWAINIGLALMVLISVLPVGLAQTWVSVRTGMWYARSADFLQDPTISFFRWLRVIGDSVFALGTLALAWFIFGLKGGWSIKKIE
jgi:nitric oxide reductase subunit B